MNGIHDMGGLHGFGRIEVEPDEPVFHERWESRVFGMLHGLGGNIDAGRHAIERLDPVTYLRNGYYGRWLAAFERLIAEAGLVTEGEIEARMRTRERPRRPAPSGARMPWRPAPPEYVREVARPPRFRDGQPVRTRNHQPPGHTRLPAYGRCRRGVVVRIHPAMVFPDDHAHGRGENPQYLYTVRFDARELWGEFAEARTAVHLDLFEPYLEAASA